MKKLDIAALRTLRSQLEQVLKPVADKNNIALILGKVTYDRDGKTATFKLEAAVKSESGEVLTRESQDYVKYASMFDVDPSKLNTVIKAGRKEYKIVGLNVKSRKFPVLGQCVEDGKQYGLPASVVRAVPLAKAGA